MYYLFGNFLTHYGSASMNHGQSRGNITPLQKVQWHNKIHSTVSADAIRWALRYFWQKKDYSVNRIWDADAFVHKLTDDNFDPDLFIDDDVLGYMTTEAAKVEVIEADINKIENTDENQTNANIRRERPKKIPGKSIPRQGALGVNRAISLTPYDGSMTFNAKSGQKDRTSLHFHEYHNTCYQYAFALDSNHLKDRSRIFAVIEGLMSIRKVGGHNNVFCYDFSPESFVFRWTQEPSPHIFYCFEQSKLESKPTISSNLIEQVEIGDIDGSELWIGGPVTKNLDIKNAHVFLGRKQAFNDLKQVIRKDLNLT